MSGTNILFFFNSFSSLRIVYLSPDNFISPFSNKYTLYCLKNYAVILIIAIIGATPLMKNMIDKLKENIVCKNIINILEPIFVVLIIFIVTAYLVDNSYNPFLYFRF